MTIDQVLAYDAKFYTSTPAVRTINHGARGWGLTIPSYANIAKKTGVQQTGQENDAKKLFDKLFSGSTKRVPPGPASNRSPTGCSKASQACGPRTGACPKPIGSVWTPHFPSGRT